MAKIFISRRSQPGGVGGGAGGARRAGPVILAPSAPYRYGFGGGGWGVVSQVSQVRLRGASRLPADSCTVM